MYGGYEGGWLSKDLYYKGYSLDMYESKAGKPYMDIKGWAENKEADPDERD